MFNLFKNNQFDFSVLSSQSVTKMENKQREKHIFINCKTSFNFVLENMEKNKKKLKEK